MFCGKNFGFAGLT